MNHVEIRNHRLTNQRIVDTDFKTPSEVVSWMGAMQAQEYAMAKWAIGLRAKGLTDSCVEKAFNDGEILRTHFLRPTWHFVSPSDIRWMLELTAPRVQQINSFMYRKMNYDYAFLNKTNDILAKALEGNQYLTRPELQETLKQNKILAEGVGLSCIMMYAELERVICSGPRKGKQFSYALLDERVPETKSLTREESLRELSNRYFTSRGPATVKDFATWSGLTVKDAKAGANSLPDEFIRKIIDNQEFIFLKEEKIFKRNQPAFLMPDYDEYGMGYKDRSAIIPTGTKPELEKAVNSGNYHLFIVDGVISGTWKRTVKGENVFVETAPFFNLNKTQEQALEKAEERFIKFASS